MNKRTKYGIPGILIITFLFSSITVMQQGVLGQQSNQTSSKNITSQKTQQPTSNVASNNTTKEPTGTTNLSILAVKDKIFPIKYNITGGKLLGFVPNKDKNTLVAVLNPGGSGEKMTLTIELPRNVIDSKGQGKTDSKFLAKIDGKDVDYKEVANNLKTRILAIDFSKDNRLIEIIGNQMVA
jgi:hypothetical protein